MALLDAAGPVHHAVAAYAVPPETDDGLLASLLAEFRIAPLRVTPCPNAAELALLAHAQHAHAAGGVSFLVGSADGRLADLAALGRVELLIWDGHPVATRLADVAHHVHRLPRPTGTTTGDQSSPAVQPENTPPHRRSRDYQNLTNRLLVAMATGAGMALSHALVAPFLSRQSTARRS